MGIARQQLYYKCETCNKCRGCSIASLREGGGPRSGGRSLRNFEFSLASLSRPLPQSAALTAPSRREPSFVHSSAYINKVPTNLLIGLWELFVDVFSPLRTTEKDCASCVFWASLFLISRDQDISNKPLCNLFPTKRS